MFYSTLLLSNGGSLERISGNFLELRVFAKIPEVAKMLQLELDEKLEAKFEKNLKDSLDLVETVFLRGPGKFLENGEEVSLADIVLVCQLKQLLVRCLGMDIARQSILVFFLCIFEKSIYILMRYGCV